MKTFLNFGKKKNKDDFFTDFPNYLYFIFIVCGVLVLYFTIIDKSLESIKKLSSSNYHDPCHTNYVIEKNVFNCPFP